jgi:hypothetical protein
MERDDNAKIRRRSTSLAGLPWAIESTYTGPSDWTLSIL